MQWKEQLLGDEGAADMKDLTFEQALDLFETDYMGARNFAPRSRQQYMADLVAMVEHFRGLRLTRPNQVELRHLEGFLGWMDSQNLAGITRRRKVSSLRAFFRFLAESGYIPRNPTEQLIPPKRDFKEPRYLKKKEYEALRKAAAKSSRDAAIIELLLQTGIRLSEVARLTLQDIILPAKGSSESEGSIFIHGKGRKERELPLNAEACRAIKAWLRVRPDIDEPGVFVTKFGKPIGKRGIQDVVTKYLKKAGIHSASVHSLRHTFATHHVAKGTSLKHVQHALGHEDLRTTSIYVQLADEGLRNDLRKNAL